MGTVWLFYAQPKHFQAFGVRVSFEKHNRSRCVIPAGFDRNQLKNRLHRTTLSERERSVCRIVLDAASEWVLSAAFIYEAAGFSATTWQKVRDDLVKRGLLVTGCERLAGGESRWHLNFDFTGLAAGLFDAVKVKKVKQGHDLEAELSTDEPKKNDHARAHVINARKVIARSTGEQRSHDQHTRVDLHPHLFTQMPPPPIPVVVAGTGLTETERKIGERLPGLSDAEVRRVGEALFDAADAQVDAMCVIYETNVVKGTVRSPAGLAVRLAQSAARGELSMPVEQQPEPPSGSAGSDIWQVLADHARWRGRLVGPDGQVAVALAGDGGQLRNPIGVLISPAASALLWTKVEAGELDFSGAGDDIH